MNRARVDIHCDQVYSMGITGRGIGVAVLDTGIFLHEDLKDRVKGFADFVRRKDRPYDDNGHGTHVAAMIGGSGASMEGKYRGVAPGCSIISVKVLDHRGMDMLQMCFPDSAGSAPTKSFWESGL